MKSNPAAKLIGLPVYFCSWLSFLMSIDVSPIIPGKSIQYHAANVSLDIFYCLRVPFQSKMTPTFCVWLLDPSQSHLECLFLALLSVGFVHFKSAKQCWLTYNSPHNIIHINITLVHRTYPTCICNTLPGCLGVAYGLWARSFTGSALCTVATGCCSQDCPWKAA